MSATPSTSALSKKTKAEILGEYERLLASQDQAKRESHDAFDPKHMEEISSAQRNFTSAGVESAVYELKKSTSERLTDVSKKISDALDTLVQQTRTGIDKFSGLNHAIELSEKRLKTISNIEVVATTLESMIAEYDEKKRKCEIEHAAQLSELSEAIAKKRRDWEREEEEHAYTIKTTRAREHVQYEEKKNMREAELRSREEAVHSAEAELANLRTQIQNIPSENEKLVRETEQNLTKRLMADQKTHIELLEHAWESEKRILELKHTYLESQHKKLESELATAKKEAEMAQKKVQELAITVIERGGGRIPIHGEVQSVEEKR